MIFGNQKSRHRIVCIGLNVRKGLYQGVVDKQTQGVIMEVWVRRIEQNLEFLMSEADLNAGMEYYLTTANKIMWASGPRPTLPLTTFGNTLPFTLP